MLNTTEYASPAITPLVLQRSHSRPTTNTGNVPLTSVPQPKVPNRPTISELNTETTIDTTPRMIMKMREIAICFSGAILIPRALGRSLDSSVEEDVRNILAEERAAASMAA